MIAGLVSIPASTATFHTIGGRTLTLLDDIGPGSLTLRDGGSITGDGTLVADVSAENGSLIAPGHSAGVLTIDGHVEMMPGSIYGAELEDHAAADETGYDQLVVTGTFSAGGQLDLDPATGFTPALGDTFDILVADLVMGGFDSVTGTALTDGIGLSVVYLPTAIRLEVGLIGDLTGDGFVGVEDLDLLLANWGDATNAGDWLAGDADGNGSVGQGDLTLVTDHWSNGTPPTPLIPEPASAILLSPLLWINSRRRITR